MIKQKLLFLENVELADAITFGYYTDGGELAIHQDQKIKNVVYKILIYLNDDFEGGETIFFENDQKTIIEKIKPEKGKAVIFDIDLFHRASTVFNGEKYSVGFRLRKK